MHDESWFYSRVDTSGGPDACWPWTGEKTSKGYGRVRGWPGVKALSTGAHRVAYDLAHPKRRLGTRQARHTCDNPPCCNPKHLVAGTNLDNRRDSVRRGRASAPIKIKSDDLATLRRLYGEGVLPAELARRFKISREQVRRLGEGLSQRRAAAPVRRPEWRKRGLRAPHFKINDKQADEIRARYAAGEATQYALADEYGVSQGLISKIVNRKGNLHE